MEGCYGGAGEYFVEASKLSMLVALGGSQGGCAIRLLVAPRRQCFGLGRDVVRAVSVGCAESLLPNGGSLFFLQNDIKCEPRIPIVSVF